ncbi:MAG: hypothetical protein F6K04_05275, partial [Leptolyngbya sp. SIO4C5]|nr:hypothetical protein [Leptolyngbya sp. SIO4C5]
MSKLLENQAINLTRLKRPEIHTLGQIQPHGILLVLQEPNLNILQISRNAAAAFGRGLDDIIGQSR